MITIKYKEQGMVYVVKATSSDEENIFTFNLGSDKWICGTLYMHKVKEPVTEAAKTGRIYKIIKHMSDPPTDSFCEICDQWGSADNDLILMAVLDHMSQEEGHNPWFWLLHCTSLKGSFMAYDNEVIYQEMSMGEDRSFKMEPCIDLRVPKTTFCRGHFELVTERSKLHSKMNNIVEASVIPFSRVVPSNTIRKKTGEMCFLLDKTHDYNSCDMEQYTYFGHKSLEPAYLLDRLFSLRENKAKMLWLIDSDEDWFSRIEFAEIIPDNFCWSLKSKAQNPNWVGTVCSFGRTKRLQKEIDWSEHIVVIGTLKYVNTVAESFKFKLDDKTVETYVTLMDIGCQEIPRMVMNIRHAFVKKNDVVNIAHPQRLPVIGPFSPEWDNNDREYDPYDEYTVTSILSCDRQLRDLWMTFREINYDFGMSTYLTKDMKRFMENVKIGLGRSPQVKDVHKCSLCLERMLEGRWTNKDRCTILGVAGTCMIAALTRDEYIIGMAKLIFQKLLRKLRADHYSMAVNDKIRDFLRDISNEPVTMVENTVRYPSAVIIGQNKWVAKMMAMYCSLYSTREEPVYVTSRREVDSYLRSSFRNNRGGFLFCMSANTFRSLEITEFKHVLLATVESYSKAFKMNIIRTHNEMCQRLVKVKTTLLACNQESIFVVTSDFVRIPKLWCFQHGLLKIPNEDNMRGITFNPFKQEESAKGEEKPP